MEVWVVLMLCRKIWMLSGKICRYLVVMWFSFWEGEIIRFLIGFNGIVVFLCIDFGNILSMLLICFSFFILYFRLFRNMLFIRCLVIVVMEGYFVSDFFSCGVEWLLFILIINIFWVFKCKVGLIGVNWCIVLLLKYLWLICIVGKIIGMVEDVIKCFILRWVCMLMCWKCF